MFKLKRELITKTITIEGLHCNGCSKRVENAFLKEKQVKDITVSFETGIAVLNLKKDMTNDEVTAIIEDLGFTVKNIE